MEYKMVDVYKGAIELLHTIPGEKAKQISARLGRIICWIHPELTTKDIVKVTRCKNCKHYKKYRKKSGFKSYPFYACSLTKTKRDPMFFCKDGEPYENA